jgi:hypothetical protein
VVQPLAAHTDEGDQDGATDRQATRPPTTIWATEAAAAKTQPYYARTVRQSDQRGQCQRPEDRASDTRDLECMGIRLPVVPELAE